MWSTLFSSFWGTVHREIPSWRRTQPGGFRRAASRQSRRATARVRGEQEVAKWQQICSVTELQIWSRARALMLKGGLTHWRHVPYLPPALIFALKITSLPDRRWVTTTMMVYNGMYRMQAGCRLCTRWLGMTWNPYYDLSSTFTSVSVNQTMGQSNTQKVMNYNSEFSSVVQNHVRLGQYTIPRLWK